MEEKKISSDLIRGHIDTIILYSLTESDKFAQQISDFICKKSENQYKINQATLYSCLDRLEKKKFVNSYWFDADDGRRKFYKITELGNEFVKNNLDNWSYSRAIIDKLMGCSHPTTIFATHNQVENRLENTNKNDILEKMTNQTKIETPQVYEKSENQTVFSTQKPTPHSNDEVKEINFRHVLQGLIINSEKNIKQESKEEIIDLSKNKRENEEKEEIAKFNETITTSKVTEKEIKFDGKVDFSDIISKNAVDGYKIRVSLKESAKNLGNLLINKLNFFTMLCFMLVPIIEFALLKILGNFSIFTTVSSIIAMSLVVASFLVFTIIYASRHKKTIYKSINYDSILTASIVVFNLFLVIFAVNFILNVDLAVIDNLISYVLIPVITSLNIVIYFSIRLLMYKTNKFTINKK